MYHTGNLLVDKITLISMVTTHTQVGLGAKVNDLKAYSHAKNYIMRKYIAI